MKTNLKLIRKIIKEQYDLSRSQTSVTHWLEDNLKDIEKNKIYYDKQKLINFLESMKNQGIHVSDQYLNGMKKHILHLNSPTKILQYLYNVYLRGSNLGLNEIKKMIREILNEQQRNKRN